MLRHLALLIGLSPLAGTGEPLPIPRLPQPLTNNAVAAVVSGGRLQVFTFFGLGAGKTWQDITNRAWGWREGDSAWHELPPVPVARGRLASTACTVAGKIYLFGGYTVDEKGGEVSTPEVFCFDPSTETYTPRAPIPIPVDDTVSLVYGDRYVYLVSGWHDKDNTSAVQIYDTQSNRWRRATDYPGPAVFGHAGAIVGGRIVITGGVQVLAEPKNGVKYAASATTRIGHIDPKDGTKIEWTGQSGPVTGLELYRMAAGVDPETRRVVMAGGTTRPYNYNGIGYDKLPSEPSPGIAIYDLARPESPQAQLSLDPPSMDHRGLVAHRGYFYLIGGMTQGQVVTAQVTSFKLGPPPSPRIFPK